MNLNLKATNPTRPKKRRVNMVCIKCGSDDVRADAFAAWDVESQQWEIVETYDKGAWCECCNDETRLKSVPLGSAGARNT